MASRASTGNAGFKAWVDEVLARRHTSEQLKKEIHAAGNIPARVLDALDKQPRLALVTLDDKQLLHMTRPAKDARGAALTAEEIKSIPEQFETADWWMDAEDPGLLMTRVRAGDEWTKVVIRLDQKVAGKGVANRIVTGALARKISIVNDARYKKI